jgi:hypothetical protein
MPIRQGLLRSDDYPSSATGAAWVASSLTLRGECLVLDHSGASGSTEQADRTSYTPGGTLTAQIPPPAFRAMLAAS